MTRPQSELPPALELLLAEIEDPYAEQEEVQKQLKDPGFKKDLYDQAEYGFENWPYETKPSAPDVLSLCPAGALNPLTPVGKCAHPQCMAKTAERFARTVALYGERIVLTDEITGVLRSYDPESIEDVGDLLSSFAALKALVPLFRAGVLTMGPPPKVYCQEHLKQFDRFCETTAAPLTEEFLEQGAFSLVKQAESEDGDVWCLKVTFDAGTTLRERFVSGPGIDLMRKGEDWIQPNSKERDLLRPFAAEKASQMARSLVTSAELAVTTHSVLATGDSTTAKVAGAIRGRELARPQFDDLARMHSLDLPWIDQLSVREVLALRSEAQSALPRFRTFLASSLGNGPDDARVANAARELRLQAAEVESELSAISRGQRWRTGLTAGSAGLSIALFAVAPAPAVAVAGLAAALAAISSMHSHVAQAETDTVRLKSSPGYVLVKARDLLQHRQDSPK